MFSSNQIFKVSGDMSQLEMALRFAIDYDESNHKRLVFQKTEDGKYCIGWKPENELPKGWQEFQFDFDTDIVSKIIAQYLYKHRESDSPYEYFDGSTDIGFVMENIPDVFSDEYEGIKNPFYGIVSFKPFMNFYAK
jgi:hypothetical protein